MVKLINTKSSVEIMDPKFYRHEHNTKVEFYKNSKSFLSKETIYHN